MSKYGLKTIPRDLFVPKFKMPKVGESKIVVLTELKKVKFGDIELDALYDRDLTDRLEYKIIYGEDFEHKLRKVFMDNEVDVNDINGVVLSIKSIPNKGASQNMRIRVCFSCKGIGCEDCQGTGYVPLYELTIRGVLEEGEKI